MRKIINRKIYDTNTATEIAEASSGRYGDFDYCKETLYLSPKGQYFLHGTGGAASKYAVQGNGFATGSQDLKILDKDEALAWLEKINAVEAIEKHFGGEIEEG